MRTTSPAPFLYVCENCDLVVGDENRLPPTLRHCPSCGSQHSFTRRDGAHEPLSALAARRVEIHPDVADQQSEEDDAALDETRTRMGLPGGLAVVFVVVAVFLIAI